MSKIHLLFNNKCSYYFCLFISLIIFSSNLQAVERTFKNSVSKNNDLFRMLEEKLIELKNAGNTKDTQVGYNVNCPNPNGSKYVDGETLKGTKFPECGLKTVTKNGVTTTLKQGIIGTMENINKFCQMFGYDKMKNGSLTTATYKNTSSNNESKDSFVISWFVNYWDKMSSLSIADEFICETTKECVEDNNCGQNQECKNNTCVDKPECTIDADCNSDALTCQDNQCVDCNGNHNGTAIKDECGECGGDGSSCAGCDGIPNSGKVNDRCGECGGDGTECCLEDSECGDGQKCENKQCVDDIKSIIPILECVMDNGDDTLTAYFGYENDNQSKITVEACTTTTNEVNVITGLNENYCDIPSTFELGRKEGIFSVIFPSDKTITWTIQNGGNNAQTIDASISSTKCADITPQAKCIDINQDGTLEAYFGYKNENNFDIIIPNGVNNFVEPESTNLPSIFTSGNIENAFSVTMENQASWTLNGITAEANTSLETCKENNAPVCEQTSYEAECQGTITKITLDGSVCTDPDNTALSYKWKTNCEDGVLENETSKDAAISFTTPGEGREVSCEVTLTVTDGLQTTTSNQTITISACDIAECMDETQSAGNFDECGICNGDNSTCKDCNGEIYGKNVEDKCGVCGGNNECLDCAGIVNGTSVIDNCGVCNGDGLSCIKSSCIEKDIISIKANLTADEFIKTLKKQTSLLLKDIPPFSGIRDLQASAKRRLNRANKTNNQIKSLVASFPDIMISCTDDVNCPNINNEATLKKIEKGFKKLRNQVGRTLRQRKLKSTQLKKLLNNNKKLYSSKIAILKEIPTISSACSK